MAGTAPVDRPRPELGVAHAARRSTRGLLSWLVIHTCAGENTLVQSELLLVDATATGGNPRAGARRDAVRFGSPVAAADTIVMLEGHPRCRALREAIAPTGAITVDLSRRHLSSGSH